MKKKLKPIVDYPKPEVRPDLYQKDAHGQLALRGKGEWSYLVKKQEKGLAPLSPPRRQKPEENSPGTGELIRGGYRVPFPDTMRGAAMLLALLFCFGELLRLGGFFPGTVFAERVRDFFSSQQAGYWSLGVRCLFVGISGISINYSRSPLRRAAVYAGGALVVALEGLLLGVEGALVNYLVFLTVATLLYALLHAHCDKIFEKLRFSVLFLLFVGAVLLTEKVHLPQDAGLGLRLLGGFAGFTVPGVESFEQYGLLPWLLFYFIGAGYGRSMRCGWTMENVYKFRLVGVDALGRWGMPVYLLHLPVLYGILSLIDLFV